MSNLVRYLMNTINPLPIEIVTAKGAYLYTQSGSDGYSDGYLDMFCDSGTTPLGYLSLEDSIALQHSPFHMPNSVIYFSRECIAQKLCEKTNMDKVFFCNSGSEAIETAIKIARKYNYNVHGDSLKDYPIYCYKGGFHGRTYGALSASDGPSYHYKGFGPFLKDFAHFDKLSQINWDNCGGILMETIFGNNDVFHHGPDFLRELKSQCNKYEIPLILDEIQCGAFRTGEFNAFTMYETEDNGDFQPDILCLAKGIACGIPTGICLAKGVYSEILQPGTHFSTFGGSPLSLMGIHHLLNTVNEDMQSRIKEKGHEISIEFIKMKGTEQARGDGYMLAIELEDDRAFEVSSKLLEKHIFLPTFRSNVIKMAPPFIITDQQLDEFVNKLSETLNEVYS